MVLEILHAAVEKALLQWAQEQGLESPPPVIFAPPPKHVKDADISLAWPMAVAKQLNKKPPEIAAAAKEVLEAIEDVRCRCAALEPAGGFFNITLLREALTDNLKRITARPAEYGSQTPAEPRKVNLEFVSANPTGPVHLASGRAATLGDSLAKILRRRGHDVRTEYYVNDAGRQVKLLGLSVKARYEQLQGKDSPVPEDGYQGDYINDIARAAPAESCDWDDERFSRFAINMMLDSHKEDMAAFATTFDTWFLETQLHEKKALDAVLERLKSLGKVYEKDDAVWLGSSGEDSDDDKDRVLVRSDGRPTYFLADIAYHQNKIDRGARELIDIWGADHHGYVPRMKAAIAALGHPPETFHPIVHQLVRLYRGKEAVKMSKRAGEFITLRELTAEAGLDACRFFFAMRTPNAHMNFDIELAKKQTNENPVFYVQYVHARVCSIFREAADRGLPAPEAGEDMSLLAHPSERALLLKLAWFPDALRACEKDLSPTPLPTYLTELSGLYHKFYEDCRVLDPAEPSLSGARLQLCAGVRDVIKEGLSLLGVSAPEEM